MGQDSGLSFGRLHLQVPPTAEEAGHCDVVEVQEIGDTNVIVFRQGTDTLTGLKSQQVCTMLTVCIQLL